MTMQFTADQVLAVTAVVSLAGGAIVTVAGWILHQKDEAQQLEMQRLQDASKAAWAAIDRLKEDRSQFWTREEHEKWRTEMKTEIRQDMSDLGNRLIREIELVSKRFSEDVSKILNNCVKCKD